MDDDVKKALVSEMRGEFQIPPFASDAELGIIAQEGYAVIDKLSPGCDVVNDEQCRSILKNYMNYGYHHRVNEFFQDFASIILMWQLSVEVKT